METIIQLDENATGFESLHWVAKAVAGKSDRREQLQCIKIEPKRIIATDGHRLHLDNVKTELKPRLYRVIKSLAKSLQLKRENEDLLSGRYPHIDSVLSEDYEFGKVTLSQDYQSQVERNLALIIRAMTDNTINPDYLAALLPMDSAHVPSDPLKPITFVNGTRQAIIMPIRMTD